MALLKELAEGIANRGRDTATPEERQRYNRGLKEILTTPYKNPADIGRAQRELAKKNHITPYSVATGYYDQPAPKDLAEAHSDQALFLLTHAALIHTHPGGFDPDILDSEACG